MSEEVGWQRIATGEAAATYAYGAIAASQRGAERNYAQQTMDAHQVARDQARRRLTPEDAQLVDAAVFDVPALDDADTGKQFAIDVELRLLDTYSAAINELEPTDWAAVAAGMRDAAARATHWGWAPTAFPAVHVPETIPQPGVQDQAQNHDGASLG